MPRPRKQAIQPKTPKRKAQNSEKALNPAAVSKLVQKAVKAAVASVMAKSKPPAKRGRPKAASAPVKKGTRKPKAVIDKKEQKRIAKRKAVASAIETRITSLIAASPYITRSQLHAYLALFTRSEMRTLEQNSKRFIIENTLARLRRRGLIVFDKSARGFYATALAHQAIDQAADLQQEIGASEWRGPECDITVQQPTVEANAVPDAAEMLWEDASDDANSIDEELPQDEEPAVELD